MADGGSDDATEAVARSAGARVVRSAPGRGTQMNAGAAAATGDTLLFLHADTLPPEGFADYIDETLDLSGTAAGAFRLRIDERRWRYRLVEWGVYARCRFRCVPYGDQGLFIRRRVFEAAGGFPDWPLLEDVELLRRLRGAGAVRLAPAAATTSARGWRRRGVWRTTAVNQACLMAYRWGVDPHRIADWRRGCLNPSGLLPGPGAAPPPPG